MDKPVFRENLIMFCEARKLSGAEASRLSGVDYQVVQNLLSRRTVEPKISDAIALARLFDATVEEMMASASSPVPCTSPEEQYASILHAVCNLDQDERQRLWSDLRQRGEPVGHVPFEESASSLAPGEHFETYRIPSPEEVKDAASSDAKELV